MAATTLEWTPSLLPVEILDLILQYVDQPALHTLSLSNSLYAELVPKHLYRAPEFPSTYRFVQFIDTIKRNEHLAKLVRSLDLSSFTENLHFGGDPVPMAGWREFKYGNLAMRYEVPVLHCDLFADMSLEFQQKYRKTSSRRISKQKGSRSPYSSTHPPPAGFLESYQYNRDIPVGALLHALTNCTKIQHINFSSVLLAPDFLVNNTGTAQCLTPSELTGRTSIHRIPQPHKYVYEIAQSPYNSKVVTPVYADDILFAMSKLPFLTSFTARRTCWLTTSRIYWFLKDACRADSNQEKSSSMRGEEWTSAGDPQRKGLREVDFEKSGITPGARWAIKGSRETVETLVGEDFEPSSVVCTALMHLNPGNCLPKSFGTCVRSVF